MNPLTAYFVAPDGYGDPAIWRGKSDDERPIDVLVRVPLNAGFFDDVAAAINAAHAEVEA